MLSKSIITLAAAASLGAAVLIPDIASAQMRGFHGSVGIGGTFHSQAGRPVSVHNGMAFHDRVAFDNRGAFHDRAAFHDRFAFRSRFHDRFAFRHHFFRNRFAVVGVPFDDDDGCLSLRHVWTPWGWTWKRVWICG